MASRSKKAAGKRPWEQSPEEDEAQFTIPEHQARYVRLARLRFGQTRLPDLDSLRGVKLGGEMADEVEQMLAVGGWQ